MSQPATQKSDLTVYQYINEPLSWFGVLVVFAVRFVYHSSTVRHMVPRMCQKHIYFQHTISMLMLDSCFAFWRAMETRSTLNCVQQCDSDFPAARNFNLLPQRIVLRFSEKRCEIRWNFQPVGSERELQWVDIAITLCMTLWSEVRSA